MEDAKEVEELYNEFKELARESSFFLKNLNLPSEAKIQVQSMLLNIVRYCGEIEQDDNWKLLQILGSYFKLAAVEERMRRLRGKIEDKQGG